MDVCRIYCGHHFLININQTSMLCALNLYSDVCQSFLNKSGEKLKEVLQNSRLGIACVCCGGCVPTVFWPSSLLEGRKGLRQPYRGSEALRFFWALFNASEISSVSICQNRIFCGTQEKNWYPSVLSKKEYHPYFGTHHALLLNLILVIKLLLNYRTELFSIVYCFINIKVKSLIPSLYLWVQLIEFEGRIREKEVADFKDKMVVILTNIRMREIGEALGRKNFIFVWLSLSIHGGLVPGPPTYRYQNPLL